MNRPSLKERAAAVGRNVVVIDSSDSDTESAAMTVPGATGMLHAKAIELQNEINRLKNERGVNLAPVNRLHEVAGRKRKLTADEYAELRENLRNNPLITPVTVCKRTDGDWDIISGNNRVDIYRELGRDEIAVFEVQATKEQGDVSAFYANLLHPSLPDYEKYLGFKQRMEVSGLNVRDTAKESGINEKLLYKIMSFDKLPSEALDIIKENPSCMGASAAEKFAKMVDRVGSDIVCSAILELAVNPERTEDSAVFSVVEAAAKMAAPKAEAKKPSDVRTNTFKLGRLKFATLLSVKNDLRISFGSEEDREELQQKIEDLIFNYIEEKKRSKV